MPLGLFKKKKKSTPVSSPDGRASAAGSVHDSRGSASGGSAAGYSNPYTSGATGNAYAGGGRPSLSGGRTSSADTGGAASFTMSPIEDPIAYPELQYGDVGPLLKKQFESTHNSDGSLKPPKINAATQDEYEMMLQDRAGTPMTRYQKDKKGEEVTLSVKIDTFEIEIRNAKVKGGINRCDIGQIAEIRRGTQALRCYEFEVSSEAAVAAESPQWAFCIMYGNAFKLKQICAVARSDKEFLAWTDGLEQLTRAKAFELYTTDKIQQRWLKKNWQQITSSGTHHITVREFKVWLQRANLKLATKATKDEFNTVDKYREGKISYPQFVELYHHLCDEFDLTRYFDRFSTDAAKEAMSAKDLVKFFKEEHNDIMSEKMASEIVARYGREGKFKVSDFVEFLHGNENEIWNPQRLTTVFQDMTMPLTHYFINSSHNTYLLGDQFRSMSSTEAYIRSLRSGCRCVEIDTWDGPNGDPIVYHGHTLTSKIKFRVVAPVIVEHGFAASKYPLILSMENHCTVPQQQIMADVFKKEFRDLLVTDTRTFEEAHAAGKYPTPEQLIYKTIIKHKKLTAGQSEVTLVVKKDGDEDMSDSIKNGFLKLQEIDGTWTKHFFVLTEEKLSYADNQDFEDEQKAEAEEEEEEEIVIEDTKETELHYGEAWFHGALTDGSPKPNGRLIAERLLRDHMRDNPEQDPNGLFLVRESTTFSGEFSLSFWRAEEAKIEHCRIRCKMGKYFLTDQVAFINLYELIEYYKRERLKSASFQILLGESVPQPPGHLGEKWFHTGISRLEAEDMLKRIRADGAFLVRPSQTDSGLSISFRAEGKIKHCRVKKEGRMYCIGDTEFDSMIEMIKYYEKHPLYRKMKLRFAVCDELLRDQEETPEEEDTYSSQSLYQTPNSVAAAIKAAKGGGGGGAAGGRGGGGGGRSMNCSCRAVFAYRAAQKDELSFPVDAIVTEVEKRDGGWWMGSYGEMRGWLPSNYVKELEQEMLQEEIDPEEEGNALGELQKSFMGVDGLHVEPRPSTKDQRLIFRIRGKDPRDKPLDVGAEDEEDMKRWAIAIDSAAQLHAAKQQSSVSKEKKMKIAVDLSDLIFYCTSVKWKDWQTSQQGGYQLMSSFGEKKAITLTNKKGGNTANLVQYCIRNFARVYPKGTRVDSSNYDPQAMWNCGMQLVALNFQTADSPMWVNHGKFRPNGGCGYLCKPSAMLDPRILFDPFSSATWSKVVMPLTIKLRIMSARHLVKPGKGVASPYVNVSVSGVDADASGNDRRTAIVPDNGFKPYWNQEVKLEIAMPELACIKFTVYDEDMFGDSNAIGQAVLPLGTQAEPLLRTGYRSIQLQNPYSCGQDLSALLVHIDIAYGATIHSQAMVLVREQLRSKQDERAELVKARAQALAESQNTSGSDAKLETVNRAILELERKAMDLDAGGDFAAGTTRAMGGGSV